MDKDERNDILEKSIAIIKDFGKKVSKITGKDVTFDFINESSFEIKDKELFLKFDKEEELLKEIFIVKSHETYYHYTSIEAMISIVCNESLRLSAITSMNDRNEAIFSDKLLGKTEKLTKTKIKAYNRRFVMCFNKTADHFNQWRLYGNNGKGVAIGFRQKKDVENSIYFGLGDIIYGKELPDLIKRLTESILKVVNLRFEFRRLYLWKNFIKHEDYKYEEEVRLLYFERDLSKYKKLEIKYYINNYGLITPYVNINLFDKSLPIELCKIVLGPNVSEKDLNKFQLRYLLDHKIPSNAIDVSVSDIKHYRST
ncbi:MAG: DUF2971 domain-containing protein [Ignavibacteriae bacterium]|nr:DUF2971 domain-containing protein [Ignavibacteriota bacterium]